MLIKVHIQGGTGVEVDIPQIKSMPKSTEDIVKEALETFARTLQQVARIAVDGEEVANMLAENLKQKTKDTARDNNYFLANV